MAWTEARKRIATRNQTIKDKIRGEGWQQEIITEGLLELGSPKHMKSGRRAEARQVQIMICRVLFVLGQADPDTIHLNLTQIPCGTCEVPKRANGHCDPCKKIRY